MRLASTFSGLASNKSWPAKTKIKPASTEPGTALTQVVWLRRNLGWLRPRWSWLNVMSIGVEQAWVGFSQIRTARAQNGAGSAVVVLTSTRPGLFSARLKQIR